MTAGPVKVILRNPRREVDVVGNRRVKDILRELEIIPETVLVICGDDLVTADQVVREGDTIELRPVMSGGSAGSPCLPTSPAAARSCRRRGRPGPP